MIDLSKPVAIAEDLYWVGSQSTHKFLQCNPYLFINGDTGVLFDPGSALDGEIVLAKVQSLLPLSQLEAIVCSHQDPDLCMALPYFERAGFKGVICCHERAALLIQYYGIKSPFYEVNYHQFSYTMKSGASIGFIFAPYLHFPGSIMSYLPKQQALISGDIFGSVTADWHLHADEDYLDGMIAFHEVYMPSHEILQVAMEELDSYPLTMVCPQHGSIIQGPLIEMAKETLKRIPCGIFIERHQSTSKNYESVKELLSQVITRLITIHGAEEIRDLFKKSPFTINIKQKQVTKSTIAEDTLWEAFFDFLGNQATGVQYLASVSTLVERISKEYDMILPTSLASVLFKTQSEAQESRTQVEQLESQLKQFEESLHRDPTTKLYNQEFYLAWLKQELAFLAKEGKVVSSCVLNIDNLDRINLDFGSSEGDKTLRLLANLLKESVDSMVQVCRVGGSTFALLCTCIREEEVLSRATALRNKIQEDDRFIIPIKISMGIFHSTEISPELHEDPEQMALLVNQTTLFRVRMAKKQGGTIVTSSAQSTGSSAAFTVLLVDNPGFSRDVLRQTLEKQSYRVITADNGLQAKEQLAEAPIDLILCELMIPKLSGITLRKRLLSTPSSEAIPFILMSANKQEHTVKRAYELGIRHFFSRPIALYELVGLIDLIAKKGV